MRANVSTIETPASTPSAVQTVGVRGAASHRAAVLAATDAATANRIVRAIVMLAIDRIWLPKQLHGSSTFRRRIRS